MMRAWKSTFLFGGFCLALGLSASFGALGCAIQPSEPFDAEEEVAEVESALAPDSAEPGAPDGLDPDDAVGEDVTEPEPHPWRPPPSALRASDGPAGPQDTDTEPEPHPWHTTDDATDARYVRTGIAP